MATEHGAKAWRRLPVNQCLRTDFPRKRSVQKKNYRSEGRFPVIDQGAGLAGYSDDESLVNVGPLPLILFGDHTRKLKFLDFPFVTGADGTRLIRAREEVANPLFLFYALRAVPIPNRGYNRHFQLLKQATILVPEDLRTQDSVARFLADLEGLAGIALSRAGAMARLRAALLAKIFREGLRGEPLRETEIGPLPASWRVARLAEHCMIRSGGTPSRAEPRFWGGEIPWVKTGEINYGNITRTEESLSEEGLAASAASVFPPGTPLMAMYGQGATRGRAAMLRIPAATNQACAAFFPSQTLQPEFLYAYFCRAYEYIRGLGHGANQKNLSAEILKGVLLPIPPNIGEQRSVADLAGVMDGLVEGSARRHAALRSLFSALLARLMTGELRLPAEAGEADG